MKDTTIKVSIESCLGYLPLLRKAIRGICSSVIENEKVFQDIDLCLNESVSNVIYHAYHNQPGLEIQINVTIFPNEFVFKVVDLGTESQDQSFLQPPAIKDVDKLDSLFESGRGLFLIHQLMDQVYYERDEDKNVLTMHKHF